jgi:hypothetical protein
VYEKDIESVSLHSSLGRVQKSRAEFYHSSVFFRSCERKNSKSRFRIDHTISKKAITSITTR